ncbi:MAG TPA: NAD(P)/FAD-dependent oxidoreductase [Flavobacteriales bacterium]|nr:NAD(P)/FAD-dependent oxidoreductase [Flavobacteriales bacterium]
MSASLTSIAAMEEVDVIVIGAGPSGCVAAAHLARQGRRVMILEKQVFPRFVIGESLLPRSMEHWEETGLLPALTEQGYAPKLGARFIRGEHEGIDLQFDDNFTTGWTRTWQAPRAHFDKVAADATAAQGVDIRYGISAEDVDLSREDRVRVTARDGSGALEVEGRFLIDSSGYGGTLVKLLGLRDDRSPNPRMAVYTHVRERDRDAWPEPMQITFEVMAVDLWFWVIPFSDGTTSLGFVGDPRHFDPFTPERPRTEAWRAMVDRSVRFRERFVDQTPLWDPHVLHDYTHYNEKLYGRNYVLTGNCAGFLDPVFSSGVMLATESGLLAAKLTERVLQGEAVDWERAYSDHIRWGAAVFRSYIDGWYNGDLQTIFFSPRVEPKVKQQIISVLAGYVWDRKNPFVARHDRILRQLAELLNGTSGARDQAAVLNAG